jgi:hypothetical protein
MDRKRATHDSWKIVPMSEARVRLRLNRTFTEEEYQLLRPGLIPEEMEDRWFI